MRGEWPTWPDPHWPLLSSPGPHRGSGPTQGAGVSRHTDRMQFCEKVHFIGSDTELPEKPAAGLAHGPKPMLGLEVQPRGGPSPGSASWPQGPRSAVTAATVLTAEPAAGRSLCRGGQSSLPGHAAVTPPRSTATLQAWPGWSGTRCPPWQPGLQLTRTTAFCC